MQRTTVWMFAVASIGTMLSGCLDPVGDGEAVDGPGLPALGDRLAFGDALLAATNPEGTENFIAVSPDGQDILTCQHNTYVRAATAASSKDGGKTWTDHDPFLQPFLGGDCDVAIDPVRGDWYLTSSNLAHGNSVAVSRDQGATWETKYLASQPTNSDTVVLSNDRQWIHAYDGHVFLATMAPFTVPNHIGMAVSHDRGATWALTKRITTGGSMDSHTHAPTEVFQGTTLLHAVYKAKYDDGGLNNGVVGPVEMVLVRSADWGKNWREETVVDRVVLQFTTPVFTEAADLVWWAYHVPTDDGADLFVMRSDDAGLTWSEPIHVAGPEGGPLGLSFWMDGRPDGGATLLWQGEGKVWGATDEEHLIAARIDRDGRLVGPPLAIEPIRHNEFAEIVHDAMGRAFIVYSQSDAPFTPAESTGGHQYVRIES